MQFQIVFDGWLSVLLSAGVAASAHMNPAATEAQIEAFEIEVGYALPEDLRALYRIADGQVDPWRITDPAPGTKVAPLFGSYLFLSLERAQSEYESWQDIRDQSGENFADDYNDTVLRPGDPPVYAEYWRPGWVPFSADGSGNHYAVDLSPPPGGNVGQIIVFGADESIRKVLAPSLTEFLRGAIARGIHNPIERTPPLFTFRVEP